MLLGTVIAVSVKPYLYDMNGTVVVLIGVEVVWTDTGHDFLGLDWGEIVSDVATPMDSITITNVEETPVTLTFTAEDLVGIDTITLTTDYDGTALLPAASVPVILTQTITATASGDWSYTMVITATEATP